MAQLNVLDGPTIDAGESVSSVLDLGTDYIVGLIMPDEWTPAVVSLLVSPDGDTFHDLLDFYGGAVTFNVQPNAAVNVDPQRLMLARYLQLRSGSKSDPVRQQKTRNFRTVGTMQLAAQLNPTGRL
jgi:hypothetical protein